MSSLLSLAPHLPFHICGGGVGYGPPWFAKLIFRYKTVDCGRESFSSNVHSLSLMSSSKADLSKGGKFTTPTKVIGFAHSTVSSLATSVLATPSNGSPRDSSVYCYKYSKSTIVDEPTFPSSAYVHLPFCRRRCYYCDFPVVPVGERTGSNGAHMDSTMSKYVDLVCQEISVYGKVTKPETPLRTVFFGGGTPSLIPPPLLLKVMEALKTHLGVSSAAEISMEMDPGTFDKERLTAFLEIGINRVSLGVQSFQEELLRVCGRAHGLKEVYEAIDTFHSVGLANWSLDLISSLPNQTIEHWNSSLQEAVLARPTHISVYDLQIEEGTLFNRWYKAGQTPLPNDEISAEFYRFASRKLKQSGFEHYEISNYAKQGYQCEHNMVYWKNLPYYAFGLGSTSYVDKRRFSRPRKMKEYTKYVENMGTSGLVTRYLQDGEEEKILDTVMLSLRLSHGLNLRAFEARFGSTLTLAICQQIVPFVARGLMEALDDDRRLIPIERYTCTHKKLSVEPDIRVHDATTSLGKTDSLGKIADTFSKEELSADAQGVEGKVIDSQNLGVDSSASRIGGTAFIRLTDPDGFLLSNEIISSIFSALPSRTKV